MRTIVNKTHRPLKVPLPQGRTLHLGPNKSGQITDVATEAKGVQRLIEKGEVELLGVKQEAEHSHPGEGQVHTSTHGRSRKTIRKSGDR